MHIYIYMRLFVCVCNNESMMTNYIEIEKNANICIYVCMYVCIHIYVCAKREGAR